MKRLPQSHANARIHRERDRTATSRLLLLLSCGLVLTGGFLFAAKQHFAAIEYGYKTEELRREQAQMLREQKQLQLEKERSLSPSQLEPAARAIGLQPVLPGQIRAGQAMQSTPATVVPTASLRR